VTIPFLILILIVVVVVAWLLQSAPLEQPWKWIVTAIVVVVFLGWLLESFGHIGPFHFGGHVGR